MSTKQETGTLVGRRVAARVDLNVKSKGERNGSIRQGTKGTIVSDDAGPDGVAHLRVRWDDDPNRALRLKREHYMRALVEIED
ncbi:MAG: hypothetical protein U0768_14470 [Anaerolineae bacterium]